MTASGFERGIDRPAQKGMTLIEVLVILAIIAVAASVSILAIGSGSGRSAQAEALRLAARVQLAADRSMLDDEAIAIMPQPNGYRFVQWNATKAKWQGPSLTTIEEPYSLPNGMTLTASDPGPLLHLGADSGGQGFVLTIHSGNRRWAVEFDGMTARAKSQAPTSS